jgi:predicted P-loop ATPase
MKKQILDQKSEKEIFLKFLKLSDYPKENIRSPFSNDKKPSFAVFKNNTFKCFSTGKQGDCFQLVADINNLNCKTEFGKVLEIIKEEFNLEINSDNKHFKYYTKEFDKAHENFFNQGNWNVSLEFLKLYNVKALDKFEFFNNSKNEIQNIKLYNGNIGFVYKVNENAEIYIPKQEKANKFILNKTTKDDVFGYGQLAENNDFIIICAGKKDCLILNANGFPAVTFRSENHFITQEQINSLKDKTDKIFICYDNDVAGHNQSNQICEKYNVNPIYLPSNYNDVADYFKAYKKEDFQNIIDETLEVIQARENKNVKQTIFHITEKYLSDYYKLRYNEIKLDVEICKKGQNNWQTLNENSLYIELQKAGINCNINNLLAIVKSEYVSKYNPIKNYFENLPKWDKKTDYINILSSYVAAADMLQFQYHFKKWAVRAVKCALIHDYFNKQAFILVHRGQNTGKSTFCRFLVPPTLSDYLAEDITQDKDARILLCKNFMINLDELAGLNKKELTSLKSIFSKTQVNERLPYDRKNSILNRICSFIGSTNEDNFLNDDTGSVRWLCFEIIKINWQYKTEFNIDMFWSQAYSLAFDKNFISEMTPEDIEGNEKRNSSFQLLSMEQELVGKYFEKPNPNNQSRLTFMTATDMLVHLNPLGVRLNKISIGKALSSMGYEKIKNSELQVYGYFVYKNPLFFDVN